MNAKRRDDPVNPWRDATLADLEVACARLAGAIGARTQQSELSEEVRYLLIAIAARISTGNTIPGSPENQLRTDSHPDFSGTFSSWHEGRRESVLRGLRMETLLRAAELALGSDGARWLHPLEGARETRPCYRGVADDTGMRACLDELAALWDAKRGA